MSAMRLLMLELCFHIVYAQVYSSRNGVTIKTVLNFKNVCKSNERKFASLLGLSIEECVQECGLRSHCVALNFQRRTKVCELLNADGKDVLHTAGCIHVRASDIGVIQKPCTDCAYGEVCDIITRQCIFKECLTTVQNVGMLGNVFDIGAVSRYNCYHGYAETNGVINATCLSSGQWSAVASCQTACGNPPSILNGNTELDTANSYSFMDTATVSCITGYIRSADKISCIESGSWETATCDAISCENPPSILNGNTELDTANSYSFMDTATVLCNTGYIRSADTISCTEYGSWETATCGPISCGNPPSILNGNTELDTANSYSFMDTATVSCNTGYIRSADTISCIESGSWESATCDPISCGNLPSIEHGTAVPDNTSVCFYLDTATVSCETLYKASANKITCTATGIWEEATCYDCYTGSSWEYTGKQNVTESGAQCQRWDSQTPRVNYYTNIDDYPDSSFSEAKNYCRNPDSSFYELWCYTVDLSKPRWELCDIPEC